MKQLYGPVFRGSWEKSILILRKMMRQEEYELCRKYKWANDLVAQFQDYPTYKELGIGVVVLKDGELVAGASSYSRYKDGIEIEIDTREDHRRKGLAYACGAKLILECLERGLYPSWDAQNKWSVGLAKKLGYHYSHEYLAYEVEWRINKMDFDRAKRKFEEYLDEYDREDDKIKLKIVHTYQVVDCSELIARKMKLSEEDIELAKMIGLLHDLGRFEQLKRFNSFEPGMMNHAKYGAGILFKQGMIRDFLEEDTWDDIIYTAIEKHSDFQIEGVEDSRTLMHAKIIRDADKLDNCRVKLEEKLTTLLEKPLDIPGEDTISEEVWHSCKERKSILSSIRRTSMDYWVSYIAYFYDIYFKETMEIILEQDYISRMFRRVEYKNPETRSKMEFLEKQITEFAHQMVNE